MLQLRGLETSVKASVIKVRLILYDTTIKFYQTLAFPDTLKVRKGIIKHFIATELNIDQGSIDWPVFLEIPKLAFDR